MDYSKVTLVEYEAKKRKIFNALRRDGFGDSGCSGVKCEGCPINELCGKYDGTTLAEMYEPVKAAQLIMEFEPPVDWSKVPVDTKILVRTNSDEIWYKRYFAEYKVGRVYAWNNGQTSYTADGKSSSWHQAKLYKEGDE